MGTLMEDVIDWGGEIFGREHMETIKECVQCGKCTGVCPAGRITALRTRKIFQMVQQDMREEIYNSPELWFCSTCYTCYERCPKGVKTTDLIRVIRNVASKDGYMHLQHKMVSMYVIKTGHTVPVKAEIGKMREELAKNVYPIDAIAPTVQRIPGIADKAGYPDLTDKPEQMEQLRTIFKETGHAKVVNFNWDKMDLDVSDEEMEAAGLKKKG